MADNRIPKSCWDAATKVAGDILNTEELRQAFQGVDDLWWEVQAEGGVDEIEVRFARRVAQVAAMQKLKGQVAKRNAAIQVIKMKQAFDKVDKFIAAGMRRDEALLTLLAGSQKSIDGAQDSVHARSFAYQGRFVISPFEKIQRERPHLMKRLSDKKLNDDIMREMYEIRDGGSPGATGNDDAKFMAKVLADTLEDSRIVANRNGMLIQKIDGYNGAQLHDEFKISNVTQKEWVEFISPLLNMSKTFPDKGVNPAKPEKVLNEIYTTITSGISRNTMSGRVKSIEKMMEFSRVLHFKDAEAALLYRDKFGHGHTVQNIISHQKRIANTIGTIEVLGPDPYNTIQKMGKQLLQDVRDDPKLSNKQKQRQARNIQLDNGDIPSLLRSHLDVAMNAHLSVGNPTSANIWATARAAVSWVKLGGASLTAVPTDAVMSGLASRIRGDGFIRGFTNYLRGLNKFRNKSEIKELHYELGMGLDTMINNLNPLIDGEGPIGLAHKISNLYFRANGLSGFTEMGRKMAAEMISARLGYHSGTGWDNLNSRFTDILSMHGINKPEWEAIRQGTLKTIDNRSFITPDSVNDLPDSVLETLVTNKSMLRDPKSRRKALERARHNLNIKIRTYISNEVNQSVLISDARTKAVGARLYGSSRRGERRHEVVAFALQFKNFPIAMWQRIMMRNWHSNHKSDVPFAIIALSIAGYAAETLKDVANGRWPPKDPTDPTTIFKSIARGGALGLYGDVLFGEAYKYGGIFESLAGPGIGTAGETFNIMQKTVFEGATWSNWLKWAERNVGFGYNLFYLKPVIDALILKDLREDLNPGANARRRTKLRNEYGQEELF